MVESLLSPSNVLLYGRVVTDLTIGQQPDPEIPEQPAPPPIQTTVTSQEGAPVQGDVPLPPPPSKAGQNKFLLRQLEADNAGFARIYGFSYEGCYFDLAPPAIFLVHGPGTDPEEIRPDVRRISRAPADADRTGVAYTDSSFSEDMRVWSYDKSDFTMRLDPASGSFEDILLAVELGDDVGAFAGAHARGAHARGAHARGAHARGAHARGAHARGAHARGAHARGNSD